MASNDLMLDAFGRVRELVHDIVAGLTPEELTYRIDDEANSIAWLVWHLTRIQDDHIAGVAGTEQIWTELGWAKRFALPFPDAATGFGHGPDEVAAVRVESGDLLIGYHDDVHARTAEYVSGLDESDLTRIVDTAWDPPVTLAVRLVSVIGDDLQHIGQAAYVRGLVKRHPDD